MIISPKSIPPLTVGVVDATTDGLDGEFTTVDPVCAFCAATAVGDVEEVVSSTAAGPAETLLLGKSQLANDCPTNEPPSPKAIGMRKDIFYPPVDSITVTPPPDAPDVPPPPLPIRRGNRRKRSAIGNIPDRLPSRSVPPEDC